jgi:hypothetical protein
MNPTALQLPPRASKPRRTGGLRADTLAVFE